MNTWDRNVDGFYKHVSRLKNLKDPKYTSWCWLCGCGRLLAGDGVKAYPRCPDCGNRVRIVHMVSTTPGYRYVVKAEPTALLSPISFPRWVGEAA